MTLKLRLPSLTLNDSIDSATQSAADQFPINIVSSLLPVGIVSEVSLPTL